MPPAALVITAAGINCDGELAEAFALAGAAVESIHLNTLIAEPSILDRFDLIGLPGGFSFGDAVAAGRIMAALIRRHLYDAIVRAVTDRGVPVFAPCNGFQIAVQAGLLPGPEAGKPWPAEPPAPVASLAPNARGRFADRWTRVEFPPSRCIWTADLVGSDRAFVLPSAHGEGRFVVDDPAVLDWLERDRHVAVRFLDADNFNGSMNRIAGVCDASGLILGLMPHPERFTRWNQHPFWTRLDARDTERHETIGLQMFRNAVRHVEQARRGAQPRMSPSTIRVPVG